MNTNYLVPRV